MTPKEQAKAVLVTMERGINGNAIGGITDGAIECALSAISALIAEHTWTSNRERKKYWEQVKQEIINQTAPSGDGGEKQNGSNYTIWKWHKSY